MTLRDLLRENKSEIVRRWQEYVLAAHHADATRFFMTEGDRFANPVGYALRSGTDAIFDGLVNGMSAEEVCRHLEPIMKARAIQDWPPSQAVSFVFALKGAIREEIVKDLSGPLPAVELDEIDAQIDQIALFAFDIYTRCREKVAELRINEIKRSVAAVFQKLGVDQAQPQPAADGDADGGSARGGVR
ncbi:MAG: RsbRD N-terminal domain-containing protein [Candidatus Aminicenantes bacterium]|nr:RsbRD N-terminal domain-containing protein [Candidatus Aminicenantes bacterium]